MNTVRKINFNDVVDTKVEIKCQFGKTSGAGPASLYLEA